MACNALIAGECDSAIVAGANLIQSPEQHIATMKAGVLSPTSTCHTFDACADGYGRGESIGALHIKKLSRAIEDGDHIRSIIRGTAVNRLVTSMSRYISPFCSVKAHLITSNVAMVKRQVSLFQVQQDKRK